MRWPQRVLALAVIGLVAACGDGRGEVEARTDWPKGVVAQVDSGNASYSAGEYDAARDHFARATDAGPRVAAAWFGLYMAEHALGHIEAADSALARSRRAAGVEVAHPPAPPN